MSDCPTSNRSGGRPILLLCRPEMRELQRKQIISCFSNSVKKLLSVIFFFKCISWSLKFKPRPIQRPQKSSRVLVMSVNRIESGGKEKKKKIQQPYNLLNASGDAFDLKDLQVSKSFVQRFRLPYYQKCHLVGRACVAINLSIGHTLGLISISTLHKKRESTFFFFLSPPRIHIRLHWI